MVVLAWLTSGRQVNSPLEELSDEPDGPFSKVNVNKSVDCGGLVTPAAGPPDKLTLLMK